MTRVFLGIGLAGVNALRIEGEEPCRRRGRRRFHRRPPPGRRQERHAIGRRVVVLGGGMTAIDAAVQAKLLGAEEVTICYRRGKEHMNASEFEQDLASSKGVIIRHWLAPKSIVARTARSPPSRWNIQGSSKAAWSAPARPV